MAFIKQRTRITCIFLLLQLLGGTPTLYALLVSSNRHKTNLIEQNGIGDNTDFIATPSGNPLHALKGNSNRHGGTPDEKNGIGGKTDFIATPSGNPSSIPSSVPSSSPTSTPSETPSSIPSSVPSSTPSAAPSSIPSQQPSDNPSSIPSSEPTETPECTLNDSGEFGVTSDDVREDGSVPIRFAYELVTSGGNINNLVEGIQSGLGSVVLSSLFNGCPLVGGADRRRILLSDDISESLTGFTSSPADEVDNLGCATNPQDGNQCTLVQGKFTLYTTSVNETEISLLQEDAITSVRLSMEEDNANLYTDDAIVGISFVDPDTLNSLKNGAKTQNFSQTSEGTNSGLVSGLVVSGLVVIVALALVMKRRKSQAGLDESRSISSSKDDEFSMDFSGVEENLDFGYDENGNAVHNSSKFPQIYESREMHGQQEIGQLNLMKNNSRNKNTILEDDDGTTDVGLNRNSNIADDSLDNNCGYTCPTENAYFCPSVIV